VSAVAEARPRPPADGSTATAPPRPAALARALPWLVLAAVMAVAFAVLMHAGRGTTFYYDDWPYLFNRQPWTPHAILHPHAQHLQLFPTLVLKTMWETIGIDDYTPYRALLALLNVLTGVLLFVYGRKRVGPWPCIPLAACLVLMEPSWFNLVFAFQINFVGAMAAGLAALLMLDRGDRRGDVLAFLLLGVSISCNGVGLPFLAGALVEVLMRSDRWRRIWIAAVPAVLYVAWRLRYVDGSTADAANVQRLPGWILDGLDDSAAAIVGTTIDFGVVIAAALVVLAIRELADPARITPRLAAAAAIPLAFWTLTGLSRAGAGVEADENRYLYASGLMLAVLGLEVARRYPLSRGVTVGITAVLAFGALFNGDKVENGGQAFRERAVTGLDAATALDIAGHLAPWDLPADPTQPLVAGPYRVVAQKYGSPGFTLDELRRQDTTRRLGVDQALARIHQITVYPVAGEEARTAEAAPEIVSGTRARGAPAGRGCLRFEPLAGSPNAVLVVPSGGLLIRAGEAKVDVHLHRFSTIWPEAPVGTAQPGATSVLAIRPDNAPEPWQAQLRFERPFTACTWAPP
jgi:hypothetical protein